MEQEAKYKTIPLDNAAGSRQITSNLYVPRWWAVTVATWPSWPPLSPRRTSSSFPSGRQVSLNEINGPTQQNEVSQLTWQRVQNLLLFKFWRSAGTWNCWGFESSPPAQVRPICSHEEALRGDEGVFFSILKFQKSQMVLNLSVSAAMCFK